MRTQVWICRDVLVRKFVCSCRLLCVGRQLFSCRFSCVVIQLWNFRLLCVWRLVLWCQVIVCGEIGVNFYGIRCEETFVEL